MEPIRFGRVDSDAVGVVLGVLRVAHFAVVSAGGNDLVKPGFVFPSERLSDSRPLAGFSNLKQREWWGAFRSVLRSRWTFAALQVLDLLTTLVAFHVGASK